ncbi:MAG TPA: nucleoside deaminase [Dissulfurispiraceae bacterium]|nr:nucleoside deaminase [Dissulfurispiraceae bacterium]
MQNDVPVSPRFPGGDVVTISLPSWAKEFTAASGACTIDEDRMRLAIALARENVLRGTGGPFGAAVFEEGSGRLVSVGVNSVERLGNSTLHAEVMALMFAQTKAGSFTLRAAGMQPHVLFTSCEPCAMCLGAILWSGVRRIVWGAPREAAAAIGFDEGPVFPASHHYLEDRGIRIVRGLLAEEAQEVLRLYQERGGIIYNP